MSGSMLVHAYKVSRINGTPQLSVLLNRIKAMNVAKRLRPINGVTYRIEHLEKLKNGTWLIDFGRFRESSGPAAAAIDKPARGLQISSDEEFFEEAAILYNEKKSYIIIQYNIHGGRANAFQEYLNSWSANEFSCYSLSVKLNPDAERALDGGAALKSLEFSIDPRVMSPKDIAGDKSLTAMLGASTEPEAGKISVKISCSRGKAKSLTSSAADMLDTLRAYVGAGKLGVTKLKAGILESDDSTIDIVDLISEKLKHRFTDIEVGVDKRLTRESRFNALQRIAKDWDGILR